MNSLILRTAAPIIVSLTVVYSVFVLFRGHNEPGGGFIGGLIAASALALYAIAEGPAALRRAVIVPPIALAGVGVFIAGLSGLLSAPFAKPFLTGLWYIPSFDKSFKVIATPVLFDIGVYLVVVGTIAGLALALEEEDVH